MTNLSTPYDRYWRIRTNLPERRGQRCRVISRGAMNSCCIETGPDTHDMAAMQAAIEAGRVKG